jgi:uncharacterized protein YdhG (YjbR/CyaY superfamily)
MVKNPVDAYLAAQPEPQRTTLQALRETIRSLLPAAEECLSYSVPAFACDGTAIAGFSGSKSHCSYLPFSGSLLESMATDVTAYRTSKGALLFPIDRPPPRTLIRKLIVARLDAESRARPRSGKVREFYENGVLKAAGKMRDGELHGDWTWYRKDGTRMRTGSFDRGTQVGVWRTWGRTEALVKETRF